MTKVHDTRAQRALELRQRLVIGRTFVSGLLNPVAEADAQRIYRIWSSTWVLPLLDELVPELRKRHAD